MATTVEVWATADPKEIGADIGRTVRSVLRRVRQAEPQLPVPQRPVPYRHSALFREPVYTDGQPYDVDDDLEDDADS
jgi:hypothetical protein